MEIAKITNLEEFLKVTLAYKEKIGDTSKAAVSTMKEMRVKLENFMTKHLVKLNKEAAKDKARQSKLLEFLLTIDENIPESDFFKNAGLDLFPTFFKLTFYNKDNSVVN